MTFQPCFLAVEKRDRMSAKSIAPSAERKPPEIFCRSFIMRTSRSACNATGFNAFDYNIGAKWLELLKEIAPHLMRVALLRDAVNRLGTGFFGAVQSVAPALGIEASPIGLRDTGEIERGRYLLCTACEWRPDCDTHLLLTRSSGADHRARREQTSRAPR
jgi:hypothetical protein